MTIWQDQDTFSKLTTFESKIKPGIKIELRKTNTRVSMNQADKKKTGMLGNHTRKEKENAIKSFFDPATPKLNLDEILKQNLRKFDRIRNS